MKNLLIVIALLLPVSSFAEAGYVKGYTRKDGTYVAPYYRGGGSSSGYTSTPTYTPPTATSTTDISNHSQLPPNFVAKKCGNAYISQQKSCLFETSNHKTKNFRDCTDAWDNGVMDIPTSDSGYAKKLDRDHDGIACEISDMYDGNTWMYDRESGVSESGEIAYIKYDDLQKIGVIAENNGGDITLRHGRHILHLADPPAIPNLDGKAIDALPAINIRGDLVVSFADTVRYLGLFVNPGSIELIYQ